MGKTCACWYRPLFVLEWIGGDERKAAADGDGDAETLFHCCGLIFGERQRVIQGERDESGVTK